MSLYTTRKISKEQLIEELEEDRDRANTYYGTKPFRYRSSEAMDRHNRTIKKLVEAGEITSQKADRLRCKY